jgi:hypothetical protein
MQRFSAAIMISLHIKQELNETDGILQGGVRLLGVREVIGFLLWSFGL